MKVEIRCPNCDKGYLVEEQDGPGEVICPGCFEQLRAPQPAATVAATMGSVAVSTLSPAAPATVAGTAAPRADAPAAGAEVVCPRCHLHFSPRRATAEARIGVRPRVLIVVEMRYFQEIAHEALSDEYEVIPATSTTEALARLAQGDIQLMVLDLTLDGDEGGINLLRSLPSKTCPILIFTAQDESEMYGDAWEELRKLGVDDMVLKGMNVGESLARKVGTLLGKPWDEES